MVRGKRDRDPTNEVAGLRRCKPNHPRSVVRHAKIKEGAPAMLVASRGVANTSVRRHRVKTIPPLSVAQRERFWAKVQKTDGCWVWTGSRIRDGYGSFRLYLPRESPFMAHRVAYTLVRGEIPAGLTIDHLCRNKSCVNPEHMEVVTLEENGRRGGIDARGRPKGQGIACRNGHPRTIENTRHRRDGQIRCRICQQQERRRYKRRRREEKKLIAAQ